jgi:hypothetical protein
MIAMSIPPPKLVYLVQRAVVFKAQGLSYEQIGLKLGKSRRTVENWRTRYRAFWDQALADARFELAAEAGDEGLAILRTLARSDDEKVRREASARLVELRPHADLASVISPDLVRFVEFLEGLSDDQLDSVLGVDVRHDDRRPEGGPAEPPCSAIPA